MFTTYALSLSFFEAVILDAFVRANAGLPLILADIQGVRDSLSEQGAHRVGKDYEVEPVRVTTGVFHAKASVLLSDDDCHVLLGSGNLTFNGWGGNCELVDHLHPTFAGAAIGDIATFFDDLARAPRVVHGAAAACAELSDSLRRIVGTRVGVGADRLRVLSNMRRPLLDQIGEWVDELGGATRLTIASPFWDGGAALDALASRLQLEHAFVHAHGAGCVEGTGGNWWPWDCLTQVSAVAVEPFGSETKRRLHAKAFEIQCRRGRLLLSGSANASSAALVGMHNVELLVARIERPATSAWVAQAARVPSRPYVNPTAPNVDSDRGVLRARLDDHRLSGQVLAPRMSGSIALTLVTSFGLVPLGDAQLDVSGGFRIEAQGLEQRAWAGGRLVIRAIDSQGRTADGFVSVASAAAIARRAGPVMRRMLALIGGTETPEDLAAIFTWFHDDPKRLADLSVGSRFGVGEHGSPRDRPGHVVPVAALDPQFAMLKGVPGEHGRAESYHWRRFIQEFLAALRARRGPIPAAERSIADEEDAASEPVAVSGLDENPLDAPRRAFDPLFDGLTTDLSPVPHVLMAWDLAAYLCDRMTPDHAVATAWLGRLVHRLVAADLPPTRRAEVAYGALVLAAQSDSAGTIRWARDCMRLLAIPLAVDPPDAPGARPFHTTLAPTVRLDEVWNRVLAARTFEEQIAAYHRALAEGKENDGYPDLPSAVPEAWRTLRLAITSARHRSQLLWCESGDDACPACQLRLPPAEQHSLDAVGVAQATQCCNRLLVRRPQVMAE